MEKTVFDSMERGCDYRCVAGSGVIWLCFCIAAACTAYRWQLAFVFGIDALLSFALAGMLYRNGSLLILTSSFDFGTNLIMCGALSLYLQYHVRLLWAGAFGGDVGSFDFGLDCDDNDEEGCQQDLAFGMGTETFGHWLQGFGAILFFPALNHVMHHYFEENVAKKARTFKDFTAPWVCAYGVYNFCKRAIKSPECFAVSSHANNGAEWACGFLMGILAGLAIEVEVGRRWTPAAPAETLSCNKTFSYMRIIGGTTLLMASIGGGLMTGLTWQNNPSNFNSEAGDWNCDGGSLDEFAEAGVVVFLTAIPLTTIALAGHFGLLPRPCDII
jgi:hypothetical protein